MNKLIAATTISVLMAAGGAFAQTNSNTGSAGSAGSQGERMTAPAPMMDDSATMDGGNTGSIGLDTTQTGSISTNSNCTPPNGASPLTESPQERAPVVQSCNPR